MTRQTAGETRVLLLIWGALGATLVAGCSGSTHPGDNPGSEAGAAGVHLGSAGVSGAPSPGGGSDGRGGAGGSVGGGANSTGGAGAGGSGNALGFGGAAGAAGSSTMPSGGSSTMPSGGSSTMPSGGSSTMPSGGSAAMSSGGGANCIVGAECKCADLSGVIQCGASGPNCVCPPAEQCQTVDDPKCFVPCGGEPFGGWVLEGSCYAGSTYNNSVCNTFTQATPGQSEFRMRILDGGDLDISVKEDWTTNSRISLACSSLLSTTSCASASYYPNVLLFGNTQRATCTANACGACDCTGQTGGSSAFTSSPDYPAVWSKSGDNQLVLNGATVPYCVQADELWIGGSAFGSQPRASYKFKKQSCVGTPTACANRTPANCAAGDDCTLGLCKATGTTSQLHCSTKTDPAGCGVLQGCTWQPNVCFGDASPTCAFVTCGEQPGCDWGPPIERCGGYSSCDGLNQADCATLGCSYTRCGAIDSNDVDCTLLQTTADCAKAPGCVSNPSSAATPCTGQTQCTAQPDPTTCGKLGCQDLGVVSCGGDGTPCTQLSLGDCDKSPSCRHEW